MRLQGMEEWAGWRGFARTALRWTLVLSVVGVIGGSVWAALTPAPRAECEEWRISAKLAAGVGAQYGWGDADGLLAEYERQGVYAMPHPGGVGGDAFPRPDGC